MAAVNVADPAPVSPLPDLTVWVGTVTFTNDPVPGTHRLLITEHEVLLTYDDETPPVGPKRLVYAETFELGLAGLAHPGGADS